MGNLITIISELNLRTVNITLDTLHILLTLAIYLTLVIVIWLTRIDPCSDRMICDIRDNKRDPDTDIPRCLSGSAGSRA